jgi:beta-phosphoglucomutase
MIQAVIFDMDGVLIEAKDWHYAALNRALRLFGYEISRYAHLTTYDGLPTKKKLEMLSIESNLPPALHDFINEMKQRYTMEIIHAQCKPMFVHEYALSSLKAKGYKLAVASNSIRDTVEVMMRKSNLDQYLDLMVAATDVEKPKPDPEIYRVVMSKLGLKPEQCLVVEDNENGIKAATSAGAYVLPIQTVQDVNLHNILNRILKLEQGQHS